MKIITYLALFLVNICVAQEKIVGYTYTTSQPVATDSLINSGNFSDNGKPLKSFVIVFNGDINRFVNKLKLDLQNVDEIRNKPGTKKIYFRKFKKPEWSDGKITLLLESSSFENRHIVTIVCTDNKDHDLLEENSPSKIEIKKYLAENLIYLTKK
jgi:hypothetical protein